MLHYGCLPSRVVLEQIVGSGPVVRVPSIPAERRLVADQPSGALSQRSDRDLAAVSHPVHAVTGV